MLCERRTFSGERMDGNDRLSSRLRELERLAVAVAEAEKSGKA